MQRGYSKSNFEKLVLPNAARPLSSAPPNSYFLGQKVNATVLSFGTMGATVSINDSDDRALIYQDEISLFRKARDDVDVVVGEKLEGTVQNIREDGKITLQLRPRVAERLPLLMRRLQNSLNDFPDGVLPVGDRSSPQDIMYFVKMTKKEFKMAVGALYKIGMAVPGPYETKLIKQQSQAQ